MSIISTGDFAKAVAPQVPKFYGLEYDRFERLYEDIFSVEDMSEAVHEDVLLSGTGLAQQTSEGEANPYDSMRQVFVARYMAADFRLGVIITKNMIADGKALNILEKRSRAMGVSVKETENLLAHNVINRAGNSAYTGADGVSLLNAAHPTSSGISFSNQPSTAADLSESALEQAYIDLGTITDDRGLKLKVYPKKLIIPRALTFEAQRILGSEFRSGTAENDINAIKNLQVFPEGILVSDYITAPTAWYIKTSESSDGLKFMWRQRVELSDDTHFDTDNAKFKLHFRCAVGWTDPRCLYGTTGP